MRLPLPLTLGIILLVATACDRGPKPDVLGPTGNDGAIFATTECVAKNPDGQRCDKKTCKTDQKSNCADFANKCLSNNHHYQGTNEGGTCSRVL